MRISPPDRRQRLLLPPSIDEFVGLNHRVRVIVEVVDQLDLSGFKVGEEEVGRPAYPPHILVSLLFYSFSLGVFSAREMERRCKTDCAFKFATAGLVPSHRSISRFRAKYQDELADLFSQVVSICRRIGLGATRVVAIDGTRQHANASIDAHVRQEQLEKELEKIRKDMKKMLAKAAQVDESEDKEAQGDPGEGGVPDALTDREARKRAIEQALDELKAAREKEANTTDPEARLQRFKEGSRPGYNAQVAVSGEDGLILASEVVQDAGDTEQLIPMLDQVEANTGERPGVIVADAGYESGENFEQLVERDQDGIVASGSALAAHKLRERSGRFQWIDFEYAPDRDEYICPAGRRLIKVGERSQNGKAAVIYKGEACANCLQKPQCTRAEVRILSVLKTAPYLLAMSERRRHDRHHGRLGGKRKAFIEGHFGHIKHNLRWRQFMRRGVAACRSEFRLLCAALNLSKLARWLAQREWSLLEGRRS
jgi:transposase